MLYTLLTVVIGLNTLRRPSWFAVLTFFASLGLVMLIVGRSLGTPAPLWLEHTKDAKLLAMRSDEPKFLYFWILPKNTIAPVYVVLPWSEKTAEQATQALGTQGSTGQAARITLGGLFARGQMRIYNSPITALPPKTK